MLKQRFGSAVIGIIIILGSLFLGEKYFAAVVGMLIVLGSWEYYDLAIARQTELNIFLITAFSLTNLLSVIYFNNMNAVLPLALVLLFFTWGKEILFGETTNIAQRLGETLLTYFYIGVLFAYLQLIRQLHTDDGYQTGLILVLYCFFLTWTNDTGAYFAGKFHGKHLLCPSVSPKKTIEGAIGGILLSICISCVFGLFGFIAMKDALILGFLCAIMAQIGDLYESAIKREAQVKDSGDVIPGHGGILDRFDSLLWVAPFVYYYFVYLI